MISTGLQKFGRRHDTKVRKAEFPTFKVANIVGDDGIRSSRNGQFNEMVVPFVRQIRTPQVVDLDPLTNRKERGEQFLSFFVGKGTPRERVRAAGEVFIFMEERCSDERLDSVPKALSQHLPIVPARGTQGRPDEDVCVNDDARTHLRMIAYMLSRG